MRAVEIFDRAGPAEAERDRPPSSAVDDEPQSFVGLFHPRRAGRPDSFGEQGLSDAFLSPR